jgi:hypothetical protein
MLIISDYAAHWMKPCSVTKNGENIHEGATVGIIQVFLKVIFMYQFFYFRTNCIIYLGEQLLTDV